MPSSDSQSDNEEQMIDTYKHHYYKPTTCLEKLSFMIIRPPRFLYKQRILNPSNSKKFANRYRYQVHQIPFKLSIYLPKQDPVRYVILYLHGNSSSRYEGFLHLEQLPNGVGLACFDFNGCGNRKEKQYITLGKYQAEEVDLAVTYLQEERGFQVVGWGRSMGSVSLLLSKRCKIMILDSPFSSLYQVSKELASTQPPMCCICFFHCLFPCVFCLVSRDIRKKTNMDPSELEILDIVRQMDPNKSLFIMAARQDTMISYEHSQRIYNQFKGKNKQLMIFDGTHNSSRPTSALVELYKFIQQCLQTKWKRISKEVTVCEQVIVMSKETMKIDNEESVPSIEMIKRQQNYVDEKDLGEKFSEMVGEQTADNKFID